MICTHAEDELRTFITYLNNSHPTITNLLSDVIFTFYNGICALQVLNLLLLLLSNSLHPIQQHLSLFSALRSHSTSLVKLRPISILNRQTNTNAFYNHRVTLYIQIEPSSIQPRSPITTHMLFRQKASHYHQWTQYLNDRGYLSFLKNVNPTSSRNRTQWSTQTQSDYHKPTQSRSACYHIQSCPSFHIKYHTKTL